MTLEKVTNLINGKFKPALDGDEIDIIDPSTDLLIGHLPGIFLLGWIPRIFHFHVLPEFANKLDSDLIPRISEIFEVLKKILSIKNDALRQISGT